MGGERAQIQIRNTLLFRYSHYIESNFTIHINLFVVHFRHTSSFIQKPDYTRNLDVPLISVCMYSSYEYFLCYMAVGLGIIPACLVLLQVMFPREKS